MMTHYLKMRGLIIVLSKLKGFVQPIEVIQSMALLVMRVVRLYSRLCQFVFNTEYCQIPQYFGP